MANPKLKEGDKAPQFSATTDSGTTFSHENFQGVKTILYFYPKDHTPGCTGQACDFRDLMPTIERVGYQVIGVSPDNIKSHLSFREKHQLNFTLISDPDKTVLNAFGVYREKKNYGRTYLGVVRSTFLINEQGIIESIFDNVRAKGHAQRVASQLS